MGIMIKPPLGKGRGTPVNVTTTVTKRISADGALKFEILEDKDTYEVVSAIEKRWLVSNIGGTDNDIDYVLTVVDRKSRGSRQLVECTAREVPIDNLKKDRVYDNVSGTFSAKSFFNIVFKGTGMDFEITHKVDSSKFENAGDGDSRLELFKQGLEHFGLEYDLIYDSKLKRYKFVLTPFVNRKASYYISDEINANAVKLEEDASEFCTYVVGYGKYTDEETFQQAGLIMEFEHPLAKRYGRIHAEPLTDGRITSETTMDRELQAIISKSLKQTLSLDFLVLKKYFKEAVPRIGDIVPVKASIIGVNDKVRIIEISTTRDSDNEIIKQSVVLGDFSRQIRYMSMVNTAANVVGGLGGGSVVAKTFQTMDQKTNALAQGTTKAIDVVNALNGTGKGLRAVNGSKIVAYERDGIKISSDGGKTFKSAITGDSINPKVIPNVTEKTQGVMSPEDKVKLDNLGKIKFITVEEREKLSNINSNSKGIVLTDDKGKKYNLIITDGKLGIKEA